VFLPESVSGRLLLHLLTLHSRNSLGHSTSTPSGIAQLRKVSEAAPTATENQDTMNIDDYIFPENISTPAGLGMSPSPELSKKEMAEKSSHAVATAIPIKTRKESSQFAIPQSVPVAHQNLRNYEEFNYVQRHVRKTSIDERRVSPYTLKTRRFLYFTQNAAESDLDAKATGKLLPSCSSCHQQHDTKRARSRR